MSAALLFGLAVGAASGFAIWYELRAIDRALTFDAPVKSRGYFMRDHAEKPYTRRARRHRRMAWRWFQLFTVALCVWSAHTLVLSVVHYNEARVIAQEQR